MPYLGNNHIAGDHVNNFKVLDDISSYTATFDGSATSVVDTTNNTIRVVEHRFIQGQRVTYTNGGGGNIGGLTTGTAYFVIYDTAFTIKLATNASNAANSTAINLSSVGSGTSHTLNAAFDGTNTKFKLTHGSGVGARLNNATQLNVAINNVVQRPNVNSVSFTEGFAIEDNHKIVFKVAPTSEDIFWGSIIANTITTFDISDHKIDTFTGDGSTTEFTLSHTPANNESLMVTINGVLQHPSNASTARAYTLIASIIQFTAAPGIGDEIQVRHIGFAGATTADVSGFYGRTGNVALTSSDNITIGDIPTVRNINASGIITATTFDGAFSSGVGGSNANFTGIVTAGVFKGGDIEGRNLKITGLSTFVGDASFTGNVSIGGTLTYEDVTNIDSVGIITARDGIDCNADLDVDGHTNLDNTNIVGMVTVTTSGDYQGPLINGNICPTVRFATNNNTTPLYKVGLSGNVADTFAISDGATSNDRLTVNATKTTINGYLHTGNVQLDHKIYHSNDTNNSIDFGTDLQYFYTNGSERLKIQNSGIIVTGVSTFSASAHVSNASGSVFFGAGNATAYGSQGGIGRAGGSNYHIGSSAVGDLCIAAEGSKRILFGTKTGTGIGGVTKRMSIASSGQVTIDGNLDAVGGIDATANSTFAGDIDVDGHTNLDNVSIAGIVTATEYRGGGSTGIKVTSAGKVLIGTSTQGSTSADELTIENTGPMGISLRTNSTGESNVYFTDGTSGTDRYTGYIAYQHQYDRFRFGVNGGQLAVQINEDKSVKFFDNVSIAGVTTNTSATYFDNQVYWRHSGSNKMFTISNNGGMNWQDDVKAEFGNSGDLKIYNVSSENHIYGATSQPIIFSTNTNERLRITSDGHTLFKGDDTGGNSALGGFGTHTWTPKVQVLHDQGQAIVRDGNEVWGGALHLAKCRGTYASPSAAAENDRAGAVYFEAHDDTDFLNYVAGIECYLDGNVASNDTPGRLVFSTTADGGANSLTERMRITKSGRVNIGDTYQTGTDLDYCRLNVYGQTSQGGTNKNLNLLNVYNYGSGNPGDITGIGLGAAASPDYTKASLAFRRNDSYGRGDLIFCINSAGNSDLVTESDEHLRLTQTGALALGQSTSSAPQENSGHYHQLQIGLGAHFYGRTDDTNIFLGSNAHRYGTAWRYTASTTASLISMGTNIQFSTAGNGTALNTISFTERLRIANGGVVEILNSNLSAFATSSSLYGANTANSKGFYWDRGTASCQSSSPRNTGWSSYYINKHNGNGGAENRYIDFWEDGNQRGNITLSGSGINYGSASDYRLKKDDVVMTDGISRVKQLRPIKYKWIEGNIDDEGFFAHEAQAVVPVAVEGTKDQVVLQSEVDAGSQRENKSAGDPIYQTMDNSKLVPVLTAALKEAIDKIETLESKVAALEGS